VLADARRVLPRSSRLAKLLPSAAQAALFTLIGGSLTAFMLPSLSTATPAIARAAHHHRRSHPSRAFVSGRLSLPHYTVLIVGYNGKVASSRAWSFHVLAPDSKVTIQLLDAHAATPARSSSAETRQRRSRA
jgi:hypothetical protein